MIHKQILNSLRLVGIGFLLLVPLGCQTDPAKSSDAVNSYRQGVHYGTYNGQEIKFHNFTGDPAFVPPTLIGGAHGLFEVIDFSPGMRRAGIGGVVRRSITIGADGRCTSAIVTHGVYRPLDEMVRRAWLSSRFTPARQAGRAVEYHGSIPITFKTL